MSRFRGFIGGAYTAYSLNVDAERCVNLYPELTLPGQNGEREVMSLRSTPGTSLFATAGSGPIRGFWEAQGRTFAVSGSTFYEISSAGVATSRGTLSTLTGTVDITDNGLQVALVDGTYGYTFTLATNSFAQISDTDFPAASSIDFVDQYVLVTEANTGQWFISALDDATDWDALDFAAAEGSPDNLLKVKVDHRDVWLFGSQSTEVWFNSGAADFPFERKSFMEKGCGGAGTIQKLDNTVFWGDADKGGSNIIYRADGAYNPLRVSTHAIEKLIKDNGGFSNCTSWVYQDDGHTFYCLNLPTANTTVVYDAATTLWHERTYTPSDGTGETRHRADNHVYCFGKHLVGDYQNGNIYELSDSVYTANTAPITRRRRAPHISKSGNRVRHTGFQLDAETGVGLSDGSDPQAMLRWSNDGGHTWSNEHWTSLGKVGQYRKRAFWSKLGMARDRVYEVVITDPVKVALVGANVGVQGGTS